jgi:alcohol dehydrogenase (NADP+)
MAIDPAINIGTVPSIRLKSGESIPIPFSVHEKKYQANLCAVIEDPLSLGEMEQLKKAERGCRLVKGQVFLWPGAKSWEDIWDKEGK